jgi:hypothetical protein
MNDNLRYISLQYIKGDNYEKITCFHSEDIKIIKEILKEPHYIEKNYKILEAILKVEKREIGESLLDDLINYISFKDLKEDIKGAITDKKESKKEANKDSSDKLKELTKLIKDLEEEIRKVEDGGDETLISNILITTTLQNIKTRYNIDIDNCKEKKKIDIEELNKIIYNSPSYKYDEDDINIYICQKFNTLNEEKEPIIKFAKKVISFLRILENLETDINESEKATNKSSIDNLEKLIKIFKKYLYICENNIKKYERIFDYNEIGSIDDAFMIESYSKFLKKLHKLKQNLETKDTKKIKRELINSLDQFFNLHGFNSPDKIDNDADINYIVQRILNYT